jgi:hypothetical protein
MTFWMLARPDGNRSALFLAGARVFFIGRCLRKTGSHFSRAMSF